MKKFSLKFFLVQSGIVLGICLLIGLIATIVSGEFVFATFMTTVVLSLVVIGILYCGLSSLFTDTLVKKTIEKQAAQNGFVNYSRFRSNGAVLLIDEQAGRIAYVANQNPYEFQVISAKDIYDIKSSYKKGPLGGTGYVYFEFFCNNKRVRIPTFTSNQMYSLKSAYVLEGISKADTYCEILQSAKNNAL